MFRVLHKDPPIPDRLSSEGKDFLRRCFRRNPVDRPTATMLLDHPFIRNSHHYNLHGSIHSFAGIKLIVRVYIIQFNLRLFQILQLQVYLNLYLQLLDRILHVTLETKQSPLKATRV